MNEVKGIMFDMDNTLLQSKIDFPAMKAEIYRYLLALDLFEDPFNVVDHTSSTLIEHARQKGISDSSYAELMRIAAKHELTGMEGAGLENGALELLQELHGRYVLVILTNNSREAALKALHNTGIAPFFDVIIGREQMKALKPSPSGFEYVMDMYSGMTRSAWISIGDSWIDGKASSDAGIPFISYGKGISFMKERGVYPVAAVEHLSELLDYL
ncbi:HAD family hydrolase [Paenibacillus lutrae]|uniref:HAD-IA family hydrolase n=1 Tax=Paenibacillus lutrae TaxID=2078573 RepID=A0A7X3K0H8_9BACL|nr:HAD family hydrolase [Paenibacillus lutrae]MVP01178.1 HAD-IA family hydrolase [Paenibacillus lutrae]